MKSKFNDDKAKACLNISEMLSMTDYDYTLLLELATDVSAKTLKNTYELVLTVELLLLSPSLKNGFIRLYGGQNSQKFDEEYKILKNVSGEHSGCVEVGSDLYELLKSQII